MRTTPFMAELERQLRAAAEREVAAHRAQPTTPGRRRWTEVLRATPTLVGVGVAVLVFGLAIVSLHHSRPGVPPAAPPVTTPADAVLPVGAPIGFRHPVRTEEGTVEPSTVRLVATFADPHGGLLWGFETYRTTGGQTCTRVGREQNGLLGLIGQDGVSHNDGRFHPFGHYALSEYCGQTDGNGNAFIVDSTAATPTSGSQSPLFGGCIPNIVGHRVHAPICRLTADRALEFGLLGPEAAAITYNAGGHTGTLPTGPGGAFIVVGPAINARYFACISDNLSPGLVTSVHYRNGSTCTPTQRRPCRPIGYVAPQHRVVTAAEVRAPVTATVRTAKRWCGSNKSARVISCQGTVPAGYRVLPNSSGMVLLQWSWVARVPASGTNAGYEYAITGSSCGGGQSSSTPIAARAGQRIVQQSLGSSGCGQHRDIIRVEYRTNVGPGGLDFASPPKPGHDGQPLVGSTTIFVPR